MSLDTHFIPAEKLAKHSKCKMDYDVTKNIQAFSEKILTDIINRSAIMTIFMGSDKITANEIAFVIEKDYDETFGIRSILKAKRQATEEHIEYKAELSRRS
ncbi:hypothetical protein PAEPH01_0089 [Pancytospora epiphaga]|nr:hypothetical protein PAEPH01_0089 [Pancytospora epiphaga]